MRKSILYVFSITLMSGMFFMSCEQDDACNYSTVAGVNYQLSKVSGSTVSDFILTPWNNPSDTLFASGSDNYIRTLPLSISDDSTTIAFISDDTIHDAIIFYHTMQLNFLDEACGFVPEFTLDSFRYSTIQIDTIEWNSNKVTTDIENVNIKIYY